MGKISFKFVVQLCWHAIILLPVMACAQGATHHKNRDMEQLIPYLTQGGYYKYVNSNLRAVIDSEFWDATLFSSTGYAQVYDPQKGTGIIDRQGDFVLAYQPKEVELSVTHNITLVRKIRKYSNNLRFWDWDYNIFSGLNQDVKRKEIEISVLETGQVLYAKKMGIDNDEPDIHVDSINSTHFLLNNNLYRIQNKRLRLMDNNILSNLQDNRLIKENKNSFTIYSLDKKSKLKLSGTSEIPLSINGRDTVLKIESQERFPPRIPRLLKDQRTGAIYSYPKYDKKFPTEIFTDNPAERQFLNEVSLIASVDQSPYFILAKFDYTLRKYIYRYIDDTGHFHREISVPHFLIVDQLNSIIWPDSKEFIPDSAIEKDWAIKRLYRNSMTENLYTIQLHKNDKELKKGLWNSQLKKWELHPQYAEIMILDLDKRIFALKDSGATDYYLFNGISQKPVNNKKYKYMYYNHLVTPLSADKPAKSYYINIYTGQEYKEELCQQ